MSFYLSSKKTTMKRIEAWMKKHNVQITAIIELKG